MKATRNNKPKMPETVTKYREQSTTKNSQDVVQDQSLINVDSGTKAAIQAFQHKTGHNFASAGVYVNNH